MYSWIWVISLENRYVYLHSTFLVEQKISRFENMDSTLKVGIFKNSKKKNVEWLNKINNNNNSWIIIIVEEKREWAGLVNRPVYKP